MCQLRKTRVYAEWINGLRDIQARARIQVRIERLAAGLFGDVKSVGEGVSELRIDAGPGRRVYFRSTEETLSYYWQVATKARKPEI